MAAAADRDRKVRRLLESIKRSLPRLEQVLSDCDGEWGGEDLVYRFFHQSFKVYAAQTHTERIVGALQAVAPRRALNSDFLRIVREGTGRVFDPSHNERWHEATRPMLEAYFHARYFLEMAVKYGRSLRVPPKAMPSGWASVMYLYGIR